MMHHRHGLRRLIGLLILLVVGLAASEAVAQRNCRPWLTAARQEQARGNTQRAAEAMRIHRECVKQAHAAAADAGTHVGRNLTWVNPLYYGVVMDAVANPPGPRVVTIPGYRPNLVPGRPPGRPPGMIGGPLQPRPPGAVTPKPPCAGGCPPGGTAGAMNRSAYGTRSPATYAQRGAMLGKYAGPTTAGTRAGLAARSAYVGRSAHAARTVQAARSARVDRAAAYGPLRRQPLRRGRF